MKSIRSENLSRLAVPAGYTGRLERLQGGLRTC